MSILTLIGGSQNASNTLDYCDKKAVIREGVNCFADTCKEDFEDVREAYGKNGGRQAMHFALAFDPNELDPQNEYDQEKALKMGVEIAHSLGPDYQSACFVHNDRDHLHCHIVVNAVSFEDGRKYQIDLNKHRDLSKEHKQPNFFDLRKKADSIVSKYGIEPLPKEKIKTKHEFTRLDKSKTWSWKDEIKDHVQKALEDSTSVFEFKNKLDENGIDYIERGKTCTFVHRRIASEPNKRGKVRSNRLIDGLTRVEIENRLESNLERYNADRQKRKEQTKKGMEERNQKKTRKYSPQSSMPNPSLSRILDDDKEKWRAKKDHEQLQKRITWEQRKHER